MHQAHLESVLADDRWDQRQVGYFPSALLTCWHMGSVFPELDLTKVRVSPGQCDKARGGKGRESVHRRDYNKGSWNVI